jgi:WD repeat-containing protein 19
VNNIALYFENKQDFLLAGKYNMKCEHYPKALKLLLSSPLNDGRALELAIDVVGVAKSDILTHELIDYLMGEKDGVPKVEIDTCNSSWCLYLFVKDTKYIFKLYMSLGQFKEAARTAIIIAREEQTLGKHYFIPILSTCSLMVKGNYRAAHDLLLDNFRQLKKLKIRIQSDLDRTLMLLHSYIIVKVRGARLTCDKYVFLHKCSFRA